MDFKTYVQNNTFSLKVVPNAKETKLIEENGGLKLYLHAVPDKGKANDTLILFFKKEFGLKVIIKSGKTSRRKIIEIIK